MQEAVLELHVFFQTSVTSFALVVYKKQPWLQVQALVIQASSIRRKFKFIAGMSEILTTKIINIYK